MTLFGYRLPRMSSLMLWCLIWEIVGRLELVLLFPPFSGVLAALVDLVQTQKFWDATWTTITTFCIGMVLAIICGVSLLYVWHRRIHALPGALQRMTG